MGFAFTVYQYSTDLRALSSLSWTFERKMSAAWYVTLLAGPLPSRPPHGYSPVFCSNILTKFLPHDMMGR